MDLERGWPAGRLDLEPLAVTHGAELAPLLDDAALHEFTGITLVLRKHRKRELPPVGTGGAHVADARGSGRDADAPAGRAPVAIGVHWM